MGVTNLQKGQKDGESLTYPNQMLLLWSGYCGGSAECEYAVDGSLLNTMMTEFTFLYSTRFSTSRLALEQEGNPCSVVL